MTALLAGHGDYTNREYGNLVRGVLIDVSIHRAVIPLGKNAHSGSAYMDKELERILEPLDTRK